MLAFGSLIRRVGRFLVPDLSYVTCLSVRKRCGDKWDQGDHDGQSPSGSEIKSYQSPTTRASSLRPETTNPKIQVELFVQQRLLTHAHFLRIAVALRKDLAFVLKAPRIIDGYGDVIAECLQQPELFPRCNTRTPSWSMDVFGASKTHRTTSRVPLWPIARSVVELLASDHPPSLALAPPTPASSSSSTPARIIAGAGVT